MCSCSNLALTVTTQKTDTLPQEPMRNDQTHRAGFGRLGLIDIHTAFAINALVAKPMA
jgi:hypothetical protein